MCKIVTKNMEYSTGFERGTFMLELYHKPRLDARPQLLKNETLLLVQPNVGLYEG
jgi:hypothetical protein